MDEQQSLDQSQEQTQDGSPKRDDRLEGVKSRAMEQLVPIIGELDSMDPERKFDLALGAMRQTDNNELASVALEAALQIEDRAIKAEALLDLIGEINYLQQSQQ